MDESNLLACVDREIFEKMLKALDVGDEKSLAIAHQARDTYVLSPVKEWIVVDPRETRTIKQKVYDEEFSDEEKHLYDAFMECPETLAFMEHLLARHLRPTAMDGLVLHSAIQDREKNPHDDAYKFPISFPGMVFYELHKRNDTIELVRALRQILTSIIDNAGLDAVHRTALHYSDKPRGFKVEDFDPIPETPSR